MSTMSQPKLLAPSLLSVIHSTDRHQPQARSYSTSRPLLVTTLLLLLSLPAPVAAQSPISNGCLNLSGSKACLGFKDFYVGVPALARYGLNTTFDTIDDFDQAIDDYTTSTRSYIAQLECYNPTDLAAFAANSTLFPYARYSKSRICAALVQDSDSSLPCSYNLALTPPPPLCKATCQQWLTSVNTTIHNNSSNTCLNINQPQVASDLQFLASSCTDWGGFNGTSPNCVNGTSNEPGNCGFSNSTNDACTYCQQNSTDPCCQNISACSSGKLSIGAIIGIVIGAVMGLVITSLALFFFCCKRQNKRVRKENSFSFKTYVAPLTQRQQQQQQQQPDDYSGNKVLLQDDYYSNHGDSHASVGMVGTMTTQTTGHKSQLSDPFGDHYEVISLANNPPTTTMTPRSNQSTLVHSTTTLSKAPTGGVLPLVTLDDPHPYDDEIDHNKDEPAYEEEFYQVVHPYPPQVADELGLQIGDIVCLAMGFDDGWALGFNVTTGSKGVFPLVCVSLIPPSVLEQLLTSSNSANEDPMVDGLSTFSSKVLVEEEEAIMEKSPQRRLSRSSQLAISIRRIREDMRRSLSLSSSTASYPRHPSPLSASNSISSRSIRPSSPSPSQLSQTADIPRRTASMVRSNNTRPSAATLEYTECDSPTSPTHQTPLFNDSNHLESFEMSPSYNHNRISKQES